MSRARHLAQNKWLFGKSPFWSAKACLRFSKRAAWRNREPIWSAAIHRRFCFVAGRPQRSPPCATERRSRCHFAARGRYFARRDSLAAIFSLTLLAKSSASLAAASVAKSDV
jgi:hypothetical protein